MKESRLHISRLLDKYSDNKQRTKEEMLAEVTGGRNVAGIVILAMLEPNAEESAEAGKLAAEIAAIPGHDDVQALVAGLAIHCTEDLAPAMLQAVEGLLLPRLRERSRLCCPKHAQAQGATPGALPKGRVPEC